MIAAAGVDIFLLGAGVESPVLANTRNRRSCGVIGASEGIHATRLLLKPNPDSQTLLEGPFGCCRDYNRGLLTHQGSEPGRVRADRRFGACLRRAPWLQGWASCHELDAMSFAGNIHPETTMHCKIRPPGGPHCIPLTFPLFPVYPLGIGRDRRAGSAGHCPTHSRHRAGQTRRPQPSIQPLVSVQANESFAVHLEVHAHPHPQP